MPPRLRSASSNWTAIDTNWKKTNTPTKHSSGLTGRKRNLGCRLYPPAGLLEVILKLQLEGANPQASPQSDLRPKGTIPGTSELIGKPPGWNWSLLPLDEHIHLPFPL